MTAATQSNKWTLSDSSSLVHRSLASERWPRNSSEQVLGRRNLLVFGMTALTHFLASVDLDELLEAHRQVTPLSPEDASRIAGIVDKWNDLQAIANLLFYPDVLPDDRSPAQPNDRSAIDCQVAAPSQASIPDVRGRITHREAHFVRPSRAVRLLAEIDQEPIVEREPARLRVGV